MAGTGYIDTNGNRHIISGMITGELPKYTMAEYTALTNKPQNWICTDYDATSEYGINATEVKYDSNTSVKDKIDTEAYKLDIANISRVQVTKNAQDTDFYLIWRTDSNNAMQLRFNSSGITMMKQTNGTWAEVWTK